MGTNTALVCQGLIEQLKALLFSDDFRERHRRSKKDFTRKRCLTFVIVVVFLLNMIKRALQDELDEFFKLLEGHEIAMRVVTKSAFCQARRKLRYEAFVELNQVQVTYFYDHFEWQTWHGFRLLAVDGSTSELPNTPEIIEHFVAWHPAAFVHWRGCRRCSMSSMRSRWKPPLLPKPLGREFWPPSTSPVSRQGTWFY